MNRLYSKITHQTLVKKTKSDNNDAACKIKALLDALRHIFLNTLTRINFHSIYSKCYEICQIGMANELYTEVNNLVDETVSSVCETLLNISSDDCINFLVQNYTNYKTNSKTVSDSLLYLQRIIQRFKISKETIYEMCLSKYLCTLFSNVNIRDRIFSLIAKELILVRLGNDSGKEFIEKMIEMFKDIKVINVQEIKDSNCVLTHWTSLSYEYFINLLVTETDKYYCNYLKENFLNGNDHKLSEEGNKTDLILSCNYSNPTNNRNHLICKKFMNDVSAILRKEESLFALLPHEDRARLLSIIIDNLLINNMDFIYSHGITHFFFNSDFESLSLAYSLVHYKEFTPLPSKLKFYQSLQEFLNNHLKLIEKDFVKRSNFNKVEYFNFYYFIEIINETKKKFYDVLKNSFNNNTKIEQMIKSSLEKIVNKDADFLVNFVHSIHEEIKISIKNKSEIKVKEFLEKFLNIFKLINNKDLFEFEYRKLLSRRLLRNATMIKETEYDFYAIMKKESGGNYVKKIKNMINDVFNSQDLNLEFRIKNESAKKKMGEKSDNRQMDFYVKVISSENWPSEGINMYSTIDLKSIQINSNRMTVPSVLDEFIGDFTNFYYGKLKNRQIVWAHDLSWAEIHAKFKNKNDNKIAKTYTLIVSSVQMVILYLFNSNKTYTLRHIIKLINIDDMEILKDHVFPLINSNILRIYPLNTFNRGESGENNFDIKEHSNSYLTLNESFECKDQKMILNNFKQVRKVLSTNTPESISHFVIEDRKHQIEASIMRTLKQNRKLHYDTLKDKIVESVINYFVPEISVIKNRIENLLDRNFIVRDLNDPNVFVYNV